jgi:hypothetical protein
VLLEASGLSNEIHLSALDELEVSGFEGECRRITATIREALAEKSNSSIWRIVHRIRLLCSKCGSRCAPEMSRELCAANSSVAFRSRMLLESERALSESHLGRPSQNHELVAGISAEGRRNCTRQQPLGSDERRSHGVLMTGLR